MGDRDVDLLWGGGEVMRVRGSRKKREGREVDSCTIKVSKKREVSERDVQESADKDSG